MKKSVQRTLKWFVAWQRGAGKKRAFHLAAPFHRRFATSFLHSLNGFMIVD
ncbi:hypothetical protein [Caldithrix abyssi]|uniref:Uncharacterized protein n=1 Tax=Caldithrix abyssi DSM 13497 TaxID=880073 RepID=A0A1J1CCU5_CALAY|nr:hypothetical protein [Caldithrix abyssi]APF19818.1 hypothetical protein Cabys_3070 [Caldithrix abyssi DSM 13497]